MLYKGTFKDINDKQYTVRITTNGDTSRVTTLTIGTPPFTTSMDSDGDTLYKNAKYQSATIKYLEKNEHYDIYSSKAHDTKVELLGEDNNVVWTGYVEPSTFNQDYQGYETEVEVNAIDGLSTLQYYKYSPISGSKSVVSFLGLLKYLVKKCDCYQYIYIQDSLAIAKGSNTNGFIKSCYISEQNFFDDKNDGETDEDVAWTCQDVLEELAQFLNMTAIAWGNGVYLLDYDAIKNGATTFWQFTLADNTESMVTIGNTYKITGDDIAESNQTVSLVDTYNKVSIKADNYTFDSIIPSIYENLENITSSSDATLKSSDNVNNGMYGEVIGSSLGSKTSENMIMMLDRTYNPQKKKFQAYNAVGVKYYKNPNYISYRYDNGKYNKTMNYTDSKSYKGAVIAKFFVKQLNNSYSYWDYYFKALTGGTITFDDWMAKNEVSNISFSNYLCLLNPLDNHISSNNIASYPFLQTNSSDTTAFFGGKNAYLLITGSYQYHVFDDDPYPIPQSQADIREGRYAIDDGQAYLLASLKWGDKYWNGKAWTVTKSTFKIPYIVEGAGKGDRRADATMFKDNKFVNTVSWRLGLDKEGYCIKAPNDGVIAGQPQFTLYCPFDPNFHSTKSGDNKGQHYKMSRVFLKDFDIQAVIGDPTFSGELDTDTVYTNIINKEYTNELDDITWKISTFDNKKPSFSAVAWKNQDGTFKYLEDTYVKALEEGELSWENSDKEAPTFGKLRQEEHMIYRLVNQYSTPSISLSMTTKLSPFSPFTRVREKFMSNKQFIIDQMDIDYENASTDLTLIEKK